MHDQRTQSLILWQKSFIFIQVTSKFQYFQVGLQIWSQWLMNDLLNKIKFLVQQCWSEFEKQERVQLVTYYRFLITQIIQGQLSSVFLNLLLLIEKELTILYSQRQHLLKIKSFIKKRTSEPIQWWLRWSMLFMLIRRVIKSN